MIPWSMGPCEINWIGWRLGLLGNPHPAIALRPDVFEGGRAEGLSTIAQMEVGERPFPGWPAAIATGVFSRYCMLHSRFSNA
jgi:hypothetical protein